MPTPSAVPGYVTVRFSPGLTANEQCLWELLSSPHLILLADGVEVQGDGRMMFLEEMIGRRRSRTLQVPIVYLPLFLFKASQLGAPKLSGNNWNDPFAYTRNVRVHTSSAAWAEVKKFVPDELKRPRSRRSMVGV